MLDSGCDRLDGAVYGIGFCIVPAIRRSVRCAVYPAGMAAGLKPISTYGVSSSLYFKLILSKRSIISSRNALHLY